MTLASASAVVLARQQPLHAFLAKADGVGRRWVAPERQRDRAVDLGEHLDGAGPEALQFRAQLVGQREPLAHEILARPRQRPQCLGGIAGGDQDLESVGVGAHQLGQHERIKAGALAARRVKARSDRRHLVGVDRDHAQPRVQRPLDQQRVRALERDQRHTEPGQPGAQRPDPALIVTVAAAFEDPPARVNHTHCVLGASPINPGETILSQDCSLRPTRTVADGEVPWWSLTDGALSARPPVADSGHLDGPPGGSGLMRTLCAGKRAWRSPDVRRRTGG